jgi:S1-C subfamily serine protease
MEFTRYQRVFITFICTLFIICSTPYIASSENNPSSFSGLFQNIRSGIVHIGLFPKDEIEDVRSIETWLGTGFVVDSECTFITAKHVLRNVDKQRVAVRFQLPSDLSKVRTVKANVVYEDETRDLAFLKIYIFNNKPCNSGTLHMFPLLEKNKFQSLAGEEIFIIGYPVIADKNIDIPIVRNGIISSNEITWSSGMMLLLDLLGVPGFSGSPVILRQSGHVVGVVYGPGPTQRAHGFEWATPLYKDDYDAIMPKIKNVRKD